MTVDAQGRILVVGRTGDSDIDMAVARYLPDGSLDSTFSNDGVATFGFPGNSFDLATSIAIDPAGRIILAGGSNSQSTEDFAMIRLSSDGTRDTGFGPTGSNGYVTQAITSGQSDQVEAVAFDSQGRIVLGGWTFFGDWDFAAARFNANGVLDSSFGTAGIKTVDFTPFANDEDTATDMVIDGQGRIILTGVSSAGGSNQFALARLTSDGARDPSFGPNTDPAELGEVTTNIAPGNSAGLAATLDPAGRIVVAGQVGSGGGSREALARYNPDGSLDTTFSDDGEVVTSTVIRADDVAVDGRGRTVTAGFADTQKLAVTRYQPDGGLDQSFGSGGVASAPVGGDNSAGYVGMSFDDHDRIVFAGPNLRSDNTTYEFGLARLIGDAIAPPAATISSGPANGALINDPMPTFEFSASEAGSIFGCGFDGLSAGCASPFTPVTPLADGPHTFNVTTSDRAGNTSAATTRTFTVDTKAPEIKIKGKKKVRTDAKKAKDKLKIKTSEPADLTCAVDKKHPKDCGSKFKTKLKLGKHKITVNATDQAGNSSDETKRVKVVPKP